MYLLIYFDRIRHLLVKFRIFVTIFYNILEILDEQPTNSLIC